MEKKAVKPARRRYDAEFKKDVLKMIESGRSVSDVCKSLGIGYNLVYVWIRRAKKNEMSGSNGSMGGIDEEKLLMQKRIRELEMERDILKKALGIFSLPI